MEPDLARIPARSRRQAMDWSLVLLSQGIEATIEHSAEAGGWGLWVAAPEYPRGLEAIRQYQAENRGWRWHRARLHRGILFDWASLAWVALLGLFFGLSERPMDLRSAGVMEGWAVSQGQWWRLFTAIWLHADIGHLASNASIGVVLLGLAMGRYGTGVGLLAAYLAGVGGNLAVWWLSAGPPGSLGASGMVMGCLGLLAAQSLSWRNPGAQRLKVLISGVLGGVMLFVLFGLAPETDVRAHLGGFISGLVLGAVLTLSPGLPHRVMVNVTSGLLFALLVIWPWWAALHHQLHP